MIERPSAIERLWLAGGEVDLQRLPGHPDRVAGRIAAFLADTDRSVEWSPRDAAP